MYKYVSHFFINSFTKNVSDEWYGAVVPEEVQIYLSILSRSLCLLEWRHKFVQFMERYMSCPNLVDECRNMAMCTGMGHNYCAVN